MKRTFWEQKEVSQRNIVYEEIDQKGCFVCEEINLQEWKDKFGVSILVNDFPAQIHSS